MRRLATGLLFFCAVAAAASETAVVTLRFSPGELKLPRGARRLLEAEFQRFRGLRRPFRVKILSWGDALPGDQRKLVEDRNDLIEATLEELDLHLPVDKFSFAERADQHPRLFRSPPMLLRKQLRSLGLGDGPSARRRVGMASRSIVIYHAEKD